MTWEQCRTVVPIIFHSLYHLHIMMHHCLTGHLDARGGFRFHAEIPTHAWICSLCYWQDSLFYTLAREFQGFRVWGKSVFRTLELTDTPTNLANEVKVGHALDQSRSVQSRGPERAHQNNEPSWRLSRTDRRFSRVLRRLIDCIYFLGVGKTKTHFEWLLWHWSSLGQFNLEPTRPDGLVGCKVPTDIERINFKEAMHMGFHYKTRCFQ